MDLYREQLLDHYRHPRGVGLKQDGGVTAAGHNPLCGDRVTIQVEIEHEKIKAMRFEGHGCVISQAAASLLSENIVGKTIGETQALGISNIQKLLGVPLPPTRIKCGLLALETLQMALKKHHA